MSIKNDFVCKICDRILSRPISVPCVCNMICKQHLVEYLKKNKKAVTFICQSCQAKFEIPKEGFIELKMVRSVIEKDVYLMEDEKNSKFELEKSLNELDYLYNEFKLKFKEFPEIQFDRFTEIRKNIEVRKEILIKKIVELSQEMMEQVAISEEAFRKKIVENKINQEIDVPKERKKMKEMFRDPYLEINTIESFKNDQEEKIKQLEDKLQSFESMKKVLCNFNFKSNFNFSNEHFGLLNLTGSYQHAVTCSSEDSLINIWDLNSNVIVKTFMPNSDKVFCLCVYQNSKLIIGSRDKSIKIYDLLSFECVKNIEDAHSNSIFCLKALKKDLFASGSSDNIVKIWDVFTGECILSLSGHSNHIRCLEQLANYNLCSGSNDQTIKIWDLTSGHSIDLKGHKGAVLCVKLLNNGLLASGSHDKLILIWERDVCIKTLRGHDSWIKSLEVTTKDFLISSSGDKSIKLWDVECGNCLHTLFGHTGLVYCTKLNSDNILISGSDDMTVRIWDLNTGNCTKVINNEAKVFDLQLLTI